MNYLITGGTGLIGTKLIAQLQYDVNAHITVLTRNINKAKKVLPYPNVTFTNGLTIKHINHADIVVNLAGEPLMDKRWSRSQKQKICQSRWQITEQLAELINQAQQPPKLLLSGSAIGIYGRQNNHIINENFSDFHPEFTFGVCHQWEKLALRAKSLATRVVLMRTGLVLDSHRGALPQMTLPFKLGIGGKIGNGKQIMSWIHIDDVIGAIMHIIYTNSLEGPVNLTAPNALSNRKFSHILAKVMARPCAFCTPAWLLKLCFGERATILVTGQHVYPEKLLLSGFRYRHARLTEALESLLVHQPPTPNIFKSELAKS